MNKLLVSALLILLACAYADEEKAVQVLSNAIYGGTSFIMIDGIQLNDTVYEVPMRDGVTLDTHIVFPMGTNASGGIAVPVVMDRTPYSVKSTLETLVEMYLWNGYACVVQSMRGRYQSGGHFSFWGKSADDAADTMAWMQQQSWCNGQVLGYGVSANGIAASMEEIEIPPPPQLQAQFLVVATADVYRSAYPGGAYRQSMIGGWLDGIDEGSYEAVVLANERYGPHWYSTDLSRIWNNTQVPAIHLGGWYDIFSQGTVQSFIGYEQLGGDGARGNQWLVMNPYGHCRGGQFDYPLVKAGVALAYKLSLSLFRNVTQGVPIPANQLPPLVLYVLSADPSVASASEGNFYACLKSWPTVSPQQFYLNAQGSLSDQVPQESTGQSQYEYDPNHPVPTLGGNNLKLKTCGPWNHAKIEERDDVIVFTSQPMKEPLAITGLVTVNLWVSSSANDTDFTAMLMDVYPDGQSYNIIDADLRMRWRNSNTQPSYMEPGKIYAIEIKLGVVPYVFNTNHSIRVDISSSNYPRFSANRNNGKMVIEGGESVVATNTIYYTDQMPSSVRTLLYLKLSNHYS